MINQTTALNKIAALKKRIWGIQGGQGAGKTFSILIFIINYACNNPNKEIYIASQELTKMRDTVIKDFITIINLFNLSSKVSLTGVLHGSPRCDFKNGSFVRFIAFDKDDVGKGLRSDLVFVNEANKVPFEPFREVTSRSERVILDFNPNAFFWFHKEIKPRNDCDFLKLTFLDNEYLSKSEITEILRYKEKGYHANGSIKNEYWANKWRVYGLGEIGGVEGACIKNWEEINTLPKDARLLCYGMDFGYTNDPTALVGLYQWNGSYIFHEFIYKTRLLNINISQEFNRLGLDSTSLIYADSAEPKSIDELRSYGHQVEPCLKGADSIVYGINLINQQEKIYVTKESVNLIKELQFYSWAKDKNGHSINKPVQGNDHLIDAARYALTSWLDNPNKGKYHVW